MHIANSYLTILIITHYPNCPLITADSGRMTLNSVEEVQRSESQDTGSPDGDTVGDILPALPSANNNKGRRGRFRTPLFPMLYPLATHTFPYVEQPLYDPYLTTFKYKLTVP